MDRRLYELVTIAAARARRSTFCVAAHSLVLRDVCDDKLVGASVASGHPRATFGPGVFLP